MTQFGIELDAENTDPEVKRLMSDPRITNFIQDSVDAFAVMPDNIRPAVLSSIVVSVIATQTSAPEECMQEFCDALLKYIAEAVRVIENHTVNYKGHA